MQLFFEGCKSKTIIEDSKIFSILTCLCYDKILGLNYIYIYIYIYIGIERATIISLFKKILIQ
jgi:hypothetical protein